MAETNKTLRLTQVKSAIGRKPNLGDLGLEALGVTLDERGMPPFDRSTMQIGDLPVFIAGDAKTYCLRNSHFSLHKRASLKIVRQQALNV